MMVWNILPSGSVARMTIISSIGCLSPFTQKERGRKHGPSPLLCSRFLLRRRFEALKTLIADDVLDPAGVPFRCCRVHTCCN